MLVTSEVLTQSFASGVSSQDLNRTAAARFRHEQLNGWFFRLGSALRRHCPLLEEIQKVSNQGKVRGSHYAGLQTVSIKDIRGSEARSKDFDAKFHPVNCHTIGRWISIYKARRNCQPLPAVDLIKVGSEYFVRDGHHRISVAHALGEQFIEAEVTVWEIAR